MKQTKIVELFKVFISELSEDDITEESLDQIKDDLKLVLILNMSL